MPIPPKYPHRFTCPQCNWKGPVQKSDVLLGPFECPKCGIRLVLEPLNTLEHFDVLAKLFKIFKR